MHDNSVFGCSWFLAAFCLPNLEFLEMTQHLILCQVLLRQSSHALEPYFFIFLHYISSTVLRLVRYLALCTVFIMHAVQVLSASKVFDLVAIRRTPTTQMQDPVVKKCCVCTWNSI